ncbi:pogo transposable element with krab domain [Plakobranchus ocellatus]|uniref:Pogo transposable element with krab domain n=1 Tax=Plakobranchus ocellatus TaxID=259542 RepID=A0AAV4BAM1_9GAST|nr:pogo transposable element with krab domain [Plakobranchus ocellatus]
MDGANFEEWFLTIIIPWVRRREGPKLMIGDNLSSHLSQHVMTKCEKINIRFVLLPPNSTAKCQSLDVSFFGPMRREWRKVMEQHKMRRPSCTSLHKA